MRTSFAGRNGVCVVAMPPQALDFDALEGSLELGRPATQIQNPQFTVVEYDRLRVLLLEGRLQLDFPPDASGELVTTATTALLEQAMSFRPTAVGFNGLLRLEQEADEDLLDPLFDLATASERLGAQVARAGFKVLFGRDEAAMTLTVDPILDDPSAWLGQVNRHHDGVPVGAVLKRAIEWFASLDTELDQLFRGLLAHPAPTEKGDADAA